MKKILTFFAVVLALACLLPCTVMAAEEEAPEFVLSEDEATLTYGEVTYTLFRGYPPLMTMPDEMYVYEQRLSCKGLGTAQALVERNLHNEDIIIVSNDERVRLYVTPAGRAVMERFAARDFSVYTTYTYPQRASVPAELVSFLDGSQADQSLRRVEVSSLESLEKHVIYGMDETNTFGHEHGAVYVIDGEYWYINYDALDNSYFDSYGYFSYRSGKVTMKRVDTDAFTAILDSREEFHIQYTYQIDEGAELSPESAALLFGIVTALLFAVPNLALCFSLVLYLREKPPRRKRYLITTLLSALLLLVMIVLLLLVICS